MTAPIGPFAKAWDAATAAKQLAHEPDAGILGTAARVDLLNQVLHDAGVKLGDFDHRVVAWLAALDDSTVGAVAGWIQRAHAGSQP